MFQRTLACQRQRDGTIHCRNLWNTPDPDEMPVIEKECKIKDNEYHCNILKNMLFKAANTRSQFQNPYFSKHYRVFLDAQAKGEEESPIGFRWNVKYHLGHLMEKRYTYSDLMEACDQFEKLCKRWYDADNEKVDFIVTVPSEKKFESKDDRPGCSYDGCIFPL
jgi:hypothetical protein